jgi:hypothetical protein
MCTRHVVSEENDRRRWIGTGKGRDGDLVTEILNY